MDGGAELPGKNADEDPEVLAPYIAALEDTARPALDTVWLDTGALRITGAIPPGRLVAVRMNADAGWHAVQDGREIPIEVDNLGFMVVHAAASDEASIEMRYRAGVEPRLMAAISVLAWIGALGGLIVWRRRSDSTTTN